MACSAWKLFSRSNVSQLRVNYSGNSRPVLHSRSLLSSETLEQNTGVLVDLKVVHGAVVGRGGLSPTLSANTAKGRECVTTEGLHDCNCAKEERRGLVKERKSGMKVKQGYSGCAPGSFRSGQLFYLSGPERVRAWPRRLLLFFSI